MPKGEMYQGTLIEGSRCPECHQPLIYNGNYWCSECDYVMPELYPEPGYKPRQKDIDAFNIAYTLLMQQRGDQPDPKALIL